jgi:hypothetical protein
MACEGFETRLIEKALADTDPALTAHLAKCADCREELAAQRALQERITNGIAAMVADEPSSALLTRVRARIAPEAAPRSTNWMQWVLAGVTVTAFAAVAMWMIGRPSGRPNGVGNLPTQSASSAPSSPSSAPIQVASQQPVQPKPAVSHEHRQIRIASHPNASVSVRATVKVAEPLLTVTANNRPAEVIVPPGQREAVLRLVNALRTGRVDAASLIRTSQPGEVAPLAITPLEVKPLNGGGGDGPGIEFDIEF